MTFLSRSVWLFILFGGASLFVAYTVLLKCRAGEAKAKKAAIQHPTVSQLKRHPSEAIRLIEQSYSDLVSLGYITEDNDDKVFKAYQDFISILKTPSQNVVKDLKRVTCPDAYHGAKSDYPDYLTNWKITNCPHGLPLSSLLTILILYEKKEDRPKFRSLVEQLLKQYHDISIIIGTDQPALHDSLKEYKSVDVIVVEKINIKTWNTLVSKASTQFVFIGREFDGFGHYSNITRGVHVLSEGRNVEAVGFGTLNPSRVWNVDCYQLSLDFYELRLTHGYSRSFNECTVCGYLDGPFLTRKSTLQNIVLDEGIGDDMAFLDFFLRLGKERGNIVSCPDVMVYYKQAKPSIMRSKESWLSFVRKNEVDTVVVSGVASDSPTRLEFNCEECGLTCSVYSYINDGLNIPTCCVRANEKLLKDFVEFCNKYHMHCEIDTGAVLAAVKLNHPMPWDLDLDAGFHKDNISTFVKYKNELERAGYSIGMDQTVHSLGMNPSSSVYSGLHMDMWTYRPNISYGNVQDGIYKPTRMRFGDFLVNVPYNPGLFARNRYGKEIFKHSHSWATLGRGTSYANYSGGDMLRCKRPGHHACMDRRIPDGNLKVVFERT